MTLSQPGTDQRTPGVDGLQKEALGDKVKAVHVAAPKIPSGLPEQRGHAFSGNGEDTEQHARRPGGQSRARLEINAHHPIFETLKKLQAEDPEKLKLYTEIMYNQALLIGGMSIEDPVAFSNAMCDIMAGQA